MPGPISREMPGGQMLSYTVGQPVSRGHGLAWVDRLGHLLGWLGVQPIVNTYLPTANPISLPATIPILYARSAGARAVLLEFRLAGSAVISLAASAGTIGWIVQGGIDGATELSGGGLFFTRTESVIRAVVDVTGLNVGELQTLDLTLESTTGFCGGIIHLVAYEVPLSASGPVGDPTGEIGMDAGWPDPSQPIIEGDTDEARGIKRIVDQVNLARTSCKRHLQCPRVDEPDATLANYTTSDSSWIFLGSSRTRAQRVVGVGGSDVYGVAAVYKTDDATSDLQIRVTSGATVATYSFPASTTRAIGFPGTFNLPTTGTDQEADILYEFRAAPGSTDGVTVFNRALISVHA